MKTDQHTGHKLATYVHTKLSGECIAFDVPKFDEIYRPSQPDHPFYTYYDKPFSRERYQYSTIPVHIGNFNIEAPETVTNVLRVPVKTAGSRKIVLPKEVEFVRGFIEHCCIYETCFNNRFDDLFAHLTVELKTIKKGGTQRTPGWHVDGFQGTKFPIKHEIEHSYLWSSTCGTEFCPQPFFINHIDDSKYMVFDEMAKQVVEANIVTCMDKNIYIFDPYMVHRSPIVKEDTTRLLIRLTFEYQKLLDPNDTVNSKLEFAVPYKYDVRNRLGTYEGGFDLRMYGFLNRHT